MQSINRVALLVRPKEPYIAWAASIDQAGDLAEVLRGEASVYLVGRNRAEVDDSAVIRRNAKRVFELELQAWHRDESAWPLRRDHGTFLRWFDVIVQPLVIDLEDIPIEGETTS